MDSARDGGLKIKDAQYGRIADVQINHLSRRESGNPHGGGAYRCGDFIASGSIFVPGLDQDEVTL
ncbi:hypothetical protein [Oleiagrimonas sp.]|jgi:hypothetical protein|uniref:hypothetical protein n=1 Tax=Oleiagrimonas sp. TaxID=2010330 RepID=UPI00262F6876|nr:hypothetical protein [Oleiagrimonas sp.]MDA3914393.1 hypothetical protein [Oleiagrimonas sp.]